MKPAEDLRMQVLVSTHGTEGIERTARMPFPRVEGVEYIVSWQIADPGAPLPPALVRDDIRVLPNSTRGVSRNRNIALDAATAPIVLISDDDLIHTRGQLERVIELFQLNPDADIITFRHESPEECSFSYPEHWFDLRHPPKGYFLTSFEMAMRLNRRTRCLRYNEWMGTGSEMLLAGEEDVLMADAREAGIRGIFVPETLVTHDHPTTCHRLGDNPGVLMAKGAVFYRVRPRSWFPALCYHALRHRHPFRFIRFTLKGVAYARKKKIFRHPRNNETIH